MLSGEAMEVSITVKVFWYATPYGLWDTNLLQLRKKPSVKREATPSSVTSVDIPQTIRRHSDSYLTFVLECSISETVHWIAVFIWTLNRFS